LTSAIPARRSLRHDRSPQHRRPACRARTHTQARHRRCQFRHHRYPHVTSFGRVGGGGASDGRRRTPLPRARGIPRQHHAPGFGGPNVSCALIEDACAQAWLIAWRQREKIDDASPLGWLVTVATHELYALLRKRRNEHDCEAIEQFASVGDPELALEAREALEALGALKPQQRDTLALRAGGYSYEEIQSLTGRTYTWVNRHVSEGKRALRLAVEITS
jgi:RNA polymerase sigma factor (sigma-70 family)